MAHKRVKIGTWKTVYKGLSIEIKQAEAIYSNGRKETFEKGIRTPSVIIVPITNSGKIVLTREYRIGARAYKWFLPVGRLDKEANPKKGAMRELQEEVGYKAKKMTLLAKYGNGNSLEYFHYVFLAEGLTEARLQVDEDEDITIHEVSLKEAMKMVLEGIIDIPDIAFAILKTNQYLKQK